MTAFENLMKILKRDDPEGETWDAFIFPNDPERFSNCKF